ncbi:RNA pyrophosphohydrolase [Teredinibacter sp. KSP-S5-2]|uniref:RNA pyrophosphohydrolase n=1 Tax=Teredinibacter sp. KSP-S5-2 TaxID=3034506 RepID=UPI002934B20A|nr:RNA pyrophosphohydrolase [Teredinibacter sp. KSP-S5-2]WNO08868.1 RNA pyrophosphohydrolase [Teredinibacter sp. KSP-S5-2]
MIDDDGFRLNVGIVIANEQGGLLWARRVGGQNAWQFPQGGIKEDESAEEALYRELNEEVGLSREDVEVVAVTKGWLRYRLPKRLVRQKEPLCIGQKQKWFLLKLKSGEQSIRLDASQPAEFDDWAWVNYWYPLSKVVSFKREVYRKALKELVSPYNRVFGGAVTDSIEDSSPGEGSACCTG